jgi:predicted Rossmann fold flavoprotein
VAPQAATARNKYACFMPLDLFRSPYYHRGLNFDVLIAGAGAAGLMCAIEAGKRGRRVALIEHTDKPGKKILISGGGRCNFTNLKVSAENFLSSNRHFAKSALARYTPEDFTGLVRKHGIPYHEKSLGQLFCDCSARDITSMLEAECRAAAVEVLVGRRITEVHHAERFALETNAGPLHARALVIATGGLSIPKLGATDFGYRIARQFGLRVVEPYPALVPLTFDAADRRRWCDLAGVSTMVAASAGAATFHEKMLITHLGLSGPAILQVSSYWRPGEDLRIDLLPGEDFHARVESRRAAGDKTAVRTLLAECLPKRLSDRWLDNEGFGQPTPSLARLEDRLHSWRLAPSGTQGFDKAEVTGGGVDTAELDSRTMECRRVPGLFFIGEVVDVTGWLGGYNFQWAWASGYAAGQAV